MTDVAGDGDEVLITQARALVPRSLGCWANIPWRENEGRACGGGLSVPPGLSKVGAVAQSTLAFLQSLSSGRCPGSREPEMGQALTREELLLADQGQRHC